MRFFLLINFIIFSYSLLAQELNDECLKSSFEVKIEKKGALWGYFNHEINLKKDRCNLSLESKNLLEEKWNVDICREPLHLKVFQYFSEKVYFQESECMDDSVETFCKKRYEILKLIEKEVLVNAEGERVNFSSEHGKAFCAYKLLESHLLNARIFSMNESIKVIKKVESITPLSIQKEVEQKPSVEVKKVEKSETKGEIVSEIKSVNKVEKDIEVKPSTKIRNF